MARPVYVRHEIVHNKQVVDGLREKGARFVEDIREIPKDAITVFSAHGVSRKVENEAGVRGLRVIDATCPLVSKVHNETKRYGRQGYEIVLIGHHGHPEVEGTMGRVSGVVHLVSNVADVATLVPTPSAKLAYVTQTTLSVDDTRAIIAALKGRFPEIRGPDVKDICYATQNPPDRGAAAGKPVRRDSGDRRRLQLELEPAAGARRGGRHRQLPDSRRRALESRLAGRRAGRWESRPGRRPRKSWFRRCSTGSARRSISP